MMNSMEWRIAYFRSLQISSNKVDMLLSFYWVMAMGAEIPGYGIVSFEIENIMASYVKR